MTENYTALYEEHKKLGASFTDFGGWQMPLKYSSELAEHHAVRKSAGLFDLSHMGEVWVTGPDAAAFLDYALVGKISAMADRQGQVLADLQRGRRHHRRPHHLPPRRREVPRGPQRRQRQGSRRGPGRAGRFRKGRRVRRHRPGRLRRDLADRRAGTQGRGDPAAPGPGRAARARHRPEVLRRRGGPVHVRRRQPGPPAGPHRLHR